MRVEAILDKIVNEQPDALAVLVRHNGACHHNLKPPYDVVAGPEILKAIGETYDLAAKLQDEGHEIGDLVLGLARYSVVSRRIDGGVIVVLTHAMARPQLIKLQVGLGMHVRALQKALDRGDGPCSEPQTATLQPPSVDAQRALGGLRRALRKVIVGT